jgi:hypothetical protein
VQQSLKELALGVQRSIEKINEANNAAFESESYSYYQKRCITNTPSLVVRKEFSKQFATVIPNKRADLRRVNPEGPLVRKERKGTYKQLTNHITIGGGCPFCHFRPQLGRVARR